MPFGLSNTTVENMPKKIENDNYLSFDGRWNHTPNGSSATASFIDENQKKVVAFEISNKVKGGGWLYRIISKYEDKLHWERSFNTAF